MQPARKIRTENGVALGSLALVLSLILLQRFPGERWWLTYLLVYSPQYVWAVPPLAAAIFLLMRRRWLLAAGSGALVLVVLTVLVGMPVSFAKPEGRAQLRVLSWNLYYGRGGPHVAELARKVWPDVICLQEADPWAETELSKLLALPQFDGWDSETCGELVILSRFRIKRLGTTHSTLWVELDVGGQDLVIANAHFGLPYTPRRPGTMKPGRLEASDRLRMSQTKQIIEELPVDGPAIVCGDFNTPPNSRIYRILTSVMRDSFRQAGSGMGLSYQRRKPMVRIDHIFVSRGVTPIRCWMPDIAVSNHRPICADLRFRAAN